ncbi:hypothetical protein ACFQY7_55555 [Actinomadura luteofluorescens]|uniref:hypothetical protein n=1 Tax=Actinomadura luteofluorescens TaxID=46163 RepID=UPI00362D5FA7
MAKYADACNLFDGDELPRKLEVLKEHCEREGRDYAEIEKTSLTFFTGTPSVGAAVDTVGRLAERGIDQVIFSQGTGQDLAASSPRRRPRPRRSSRRAGEPLPRAAARRAGARLRPRAGTRASPG